jgi:hypothetical protein
MLFDAVTAALPVASRRVAPPLAIRRRFARNSRLAAAELVDVVAAVAVRDGEESNISAGLAVVDVVVVVVIVVAAVVPAVESVERPAL